MRRGAGAGRPVRRALPRTILWTRMTPCDRANEAGERAFPRGTWAATIGHRRIMLDET